MSSAIGRAKQLLRARRTDLLAMGILLAAVLVFYGPVILGRAWLPRGGGDLVSFLYPMYRFIAASLSEGQLPLWNPHQYGGAPLIADNQSGMFYPFNLILFLLRPSFGYRMLEMMVVGHVWLAGAGMYACLRLLRTQGRDTRLLGAGPALLGALAFMFSDVFVIHAGNLNLIAVSAWLPLVFLAYHRGLVAESKRRARLWIGAAGVMMGVASLAGHGQMTFIVASFLGVYALYCAIVHRERRAIPALLAVGMVAVGLAAIALLPAAMLTELTRRGSFAYEEASRYALPLRGLAGLLAPGYWGRSSADYWGSWPRVEAGYLGVLPLLLAAVSLRRRRSAFFGLAALLFLLMALGPATPLHRVVFTLLPLPFQVPARWVLLADFALAVMAAEGAALLATEVRSVGRRWFGLTGAILVALTLVLAAGAASLWQSASAAQQDQLVQAIILFVALWLAGLLLLGWRAAGRLSAGAFIVLALVLSLIDLVGQGRTVELEPNRPTAGYEHEAAVAYLQDDPGLHRLDVATGLWQASAAQMYGLYDIGGVFNPLQLANHAVYMGAVGFRGSPLYNLTGVKYIVADKTEPPGDTSFIVPVFNGDAAVDVYLNTRALPRTFLVYDAIPVSDADEAFAVTHAADFEPATSIVVEGGQNLPGGTGNGRVDVVAYDLNFVALDVTTDRPAYLFLSDVYHPDWRATVAGEATEIVPANYAFRGIHLAEPGSHRVELRFVPRGWQLGLTLTLLTLVGLTLGLGVGLHRRRAARGTR